MTPARRRRRQRPAILHQNPKAVTWAREVAGLNKQALAQRVGISPQLMGEIETGWRSATPANLQKIAEILSCPVVLLERRKMPHESDWFSPPPIGIDAFALIRNAEGRVLMVKPSYEPYLSVWKLPGNTTQFNEWPHDACMRALWTELGLEPNFLSVGSLLVVDETAASDEGVARLTFVYNCGHIPADTTLTFPEPEAPGKQSEITGAQWVSLRDLRRYTTGQQTRRILAAVAAAHVPDAPRELIDGRDRFEIRPNE